MALLVAPSAARATQHRISGGEDPPGAASLAASPRGFVAAWSTTPRHPQDNAGEVYARALDTAGRPAGPVLRLSHMGDRFGAGAGSVSIAFDRRSRRYLVLWDGTGPTERVQGCGPSFPGTQPPPCAQAETAIYGRFLDARGRPLGRQRRVAAAGSAGLMARPGGGFLVGYQTGENGRVRAGTFTIDAHGHRGTPRLLASDGCGDCLLLRLMPRGAGALATVIRATREGLDDALLVRGLDGAGRALGPAREVLTGGSTTSVAVGASGGRILGARERSDPNPDGTSHFSLETRSLVPEGPVVRLDRDATDLQLLPAADGGWVLVGVQTSGVADSEIYAIPLAADGRQSGERTPVSTPDLNDDVFRTVAALGPRSALAAWIVQPHREGGGIELYAATVPGVR